ITPELKEFETKALFVKVKIDAVFASGGDFVCHCASLLSAFILPQSGGAVKHLPFAGKFLPHGECRLT
ncbi:MAG: hypothetical protein EGQ82_04055, partial [Clostridiales bacterium]|nr:hypothetical protein [Clostridiales bacterium]